MILTRHHHPLRLAYLEDKQADAEAFLQSWQDYRPRLQNQVDMFRSAEEYFALQQVPFPLWHDIILVDLELPGMHGAEFIRTAKAQQELAQRSLIIVTASTAAIAQQIQRMTGAEGWAEKPVRAAGILKALGEIGDRYGLEIINLDDPEPVAGRIWSPESAGA